ncbi:MAG: YdcF family protein [Clostridia bacterium]|nr:YdcF family protein [Clostridia bacterium]
MEYFLYAVFALLLLAVAAFITAEIKSCRGNAEGEKDFLLILGCRVRGDEAEETLRMRAVKAAEYMREHPHTVAIACGGIVHEDQNISEAQAIEEILISEGTEKERIIREDKSTTTVENFKNAKKIIGDPEGQRIALLSSDFHLMRAKLIAKKAGLDCQTVSAPSPKKEKAKNYVREFFAFVIFIIGGK